MNLHEVTPATKRKLYVITEEGEDGTDTWIIGDTTDLELDYREFYFDRHNPDEESVEREIRELTTLLTEIEDRSLTDMLAARQQWLDEARNFDRLEAERARRAREAQLAAARKLLEEAGELP